MRDEARGRRRTLRSLLEEIMSRLISLSIKSTALLCLGLALASGGVFAPRKAAAQDLQASIVGLWKVTSHANKIPATGALEHPFGEHPHSYQLFTRGGRMLNVILGENRKRPAGTIPTDAERAALFNTLVAQIATYKTDGNKLLVHYEAAESPSADGTDRTYTAEVSGNKLTLTAMPFTSSQGQQVISIRTFERAE
jgi:hypothetical protein